MYRRLPSKALRPFGNRVSLGNIVLFHENFLTLICCYFLFVGMMWGGGEDAYPTMPMERTEDIFVESVLSFYVFVGSVAGTQTVTFIC